MLTLVNNNNVCYTINSTVHGQRASVAGMARSKNIFVCFAWLLFGKLFPTFFVERKVFSTSIEDLMMAVNQSVCT